MAGTTGLMAPKKHTSGKHGPEPKKTYKMVRIRFILTEAGEARASVLAQDFTQYVNDALRMRLEAEGAWPPAKPRP